MRTMQEIHKSNFSFHKAWMIGVLLAYFNINAFSQSPGSVDLSFNSTDIGFGHGDPTNNSVVTIALQPDGKVIAGGDFISLHGSDQFRLGRFSSGGVVDQTFQTGFGQFPGTINRINSTIALQDGKIIIGGSFNATGPDNLTRLNSDGTIDVTFNTGNGPNLGVSKVMLTADGKLLIVGGFTSYNGVSRNQIARLHADGSLDLTFDPGNGPNGLVRTLSIQDDGKILVGGDFNTFNGISQNRLARLNSDGTLDASFSIGSGFSFTFGSIGVSSIQLQPDGKIIVAGGFNSFNGNSVGRVVRLNPDGTADTGFNPGTGANGEVLDVLIEPGGAIFLVGSFSSFDGVNRGVIVKLNSNGSLNNTFNSINAIGSGKCLLQQPDGKLLVGLSPSSFDGTPRYAVTRLNPDGSLDYGFSGGTGASNGVEQVLVQPDHKIVIAGNFKLFNGFWCNSIARLHPDGSIDTSFISNPGSGVQPVATMVLQPDGKIVISGPFISYHGVPRNRIARLNSDGSLDLTFNPGTGINTSLTTAQDIVIQSDGKILIAGGFTSYNGITRNKIARLNSDGSLDLTFSPGAGPTIGSGPGGSLGGIYAIGLQSNGKIIVGGKFDYFNGILAENIVRLNSDGSIDASFITGTGLELSGVPLSGDVNAVAIQPDDKVLITGAYNLYNGVNVSTLIRLNSNGILDPSFNSNTVTQLYSITLQPDGKFLCITPGGVQIGSTTVNRLCRFHANGALDTGFDTGLGPDNELYQIARKPDGKILIAGAFLSYNGTGRNRIARIYGDQPISIGTGSFSTTSLCQGESLSVPFTVSGPSIPSTTFIAQLSNTQGDFSNPVSIGSINGNASGIINAMIPVSTLPGNGYKIRVVSHAAYTSTESNTPITIKAVPTLSISASPTSICVGDIANLTAAGADAFSWLPGPGMAGLSGAIATISVISAGTFTYSVIGTTNGCSSTHISQIIANPKPVVLIVSSKTEICEGENITLTATGASIYSWNTTQTVPAISVSPIVNATFTVIGTNQFGCISNDTVALLVNPRPLINAVAFPAAICTGQSSVLSADGGNSYSWSGGFVGNNLTVSPSTTTTYTVSGQSVQGCGNTAIVSLTVYQLPNILASANPASICLGQSSVITSTGAATYSWSTGQQTNQISVAPVTTSSYTVTGTSVEGCSNYTTITIPVNPLPDVSVSASQSSICSGQVNYLTAIGASQFSWNTGETGSIIEVSPAGSTTYSVIGTTVSGCSETANFFVQVNQLPIIEVSSSQSAICLGDMTTLSAAGAYNYSWSNGQSGASISVAPISTNTYSVTGITIEGCESAAYTIIHVNPIPIIVASNVSACVGSDIELNASGSNEYSYSWTGPNNFFSSSLNPELLNVTESMAGLYTLIAANNGCTNQVTEVLSVFPLPLPSFEIQSEGCCSITIIDQTEGASGYSYSFGDNSPLYTSQNPNHTYGSSGFYTITQTVVNAEGCSSSYSKTVEIKKSGRIELFPNPSLGVFNIDLTGVDGTEPVLVEVYSVLGQYIFSAAILSGKVSDMHVPGLANGVYPVRIHLKNETLVRNLVIRH